MPTSAVGSRFESVSMQSRIPAASASSAIARTFSSNAAICSASLRVAGERVQDEDPELLAGAEHVRQPPLPFLGVELRVAAHRDDTEAVLVEQPPRVGDHGRVDRVRIEMLEKALDRADLDVLEACLRKTAERLLERVRLEDDRRARLDPPHASSLPARLLDAAPVHGAGGERLAGGDHLVDADVLVAGVCHGQVARAEARSTGCPHARARSPPSRRRSSTGCCGLGGATASPVTSSNARAIACGSGCSQSVCMPG